jgi:hypothetical protein
MRAQGVAQLGANLLTCRIMFGTATHWGAIIMITRVLRPTKSENLPMSNTMTMPKKERAEDVSNMRQKRPAMERYRLQVDRQTKSSFPTQALAEKAGASIKKAHPQVHVSIYDAEESITTVL